MKKLGAGLLVLGALVLFVLSSRRASDADAFADWNRRNVDYMRDPAHNPPPGPWPPEPGR